VGVLVLDVSVISARRVGVGRFRDFSTARQSRALQIRDFYDIWVNASERWR